MCPVIILDQNIVIELRKKKESIQQAIPLYGTTDQKNVHLLCKSYFVV